MTGYAGMFEAHLTVAPTGDQERLRELARAHGAKYTRILLDRGAHPDQPMLTVRGRGVLDDLRVLVDDWVARLSGAGFGVRRAKIEAAPTNDGIPQTADLPAGSYFEHHVKLILADEAAIAAVRAISVRHAAHVSRNARRVRADGTHERFVTQRCHDAGQPEARRRLRLLIHELTMAGHPPAEVEEEFVVADSDLTLDAGWLP